MVYMPYSGTQMAPRCTPILSLRMPHAPPTTRVAAALDLRAAATDRSGVVRVNNLIAHEMDANGTQQAVASPWIVGIPMPLSLISSASWVQVSIYNCTVI